MLTSALTIDFGLLAGCALVFWLVVIALGGIWRRLSNPVLPTLFGLGCLLLLIATGLGNTSGAVQLSFGERTFTYVIDPLARWFIFIIALIGIPVAFFAPGYLEHHKRKISTGHTWAGMAVLFASMIGVVVSANAIAFLVAWEVMAFSSFALVASDHQQRSIRRAALVYLGATRVGTAFLMGGFLWAYLLTGSWTFTNWILSGPQALGPAILILVGLATKAGSWPVHLWLPIAHPAAPAPVSAVMSGVMIKTAIYAIVRLFVLSPIHSPEIGYTILILGAITSIWGILFAILQHDLKRLLAYSSVENIGLIFLGIGLSLVARLHHLDSLANVALAAALFHTLNHAVFKSLLFLSTGSVDAGTGIRNVEKLGGLIHRMPWTAACFFIGSAAICALPPLNGFASEWVLYKGFFTLAMSGPDPMIRMAGLVLMAWVAVVGALAIACFVKAMGVVFLGVPRSEHAEKAKESSKPMIGALMLLSSFCVVLGLGTPWVLSLLQPIVSTTPSNTLASAWNLPLVIITVSLAVLMTAVSFWLKAQRQKHPGRKFITWECGFGSLGPRTQYTATSFVQPISQLFGAIYRYAIEVTIRNKQKEHFPGEIEVETVHEAYLETRLYVPILKAIRRGAGRLIMRMQAGSIHQYLLYMVIVLAILLWVGVAR